ncbi:MAG: cob(I)yrinic acid a,c-diamide adenosyltransferase [Clostridium sp.]|nr:cob(I)yrinic acid a,c-diamide adenosyltransferase [Clostridium sp.]
MKIYTRTGDKGLTSLVGGKRVPKTSSRLEAYGTVDELNSHIGLLLAYGEIPPQAVGTLRRVQHRLFNLGSQLATEPESPYQPQGISQRDVAELENAIDETEERLPRHDRFILPGGTLASAQAHVCRTVARRAERRMLQMAEDDNPVGPEALSYINRLSDYLFVLAREINKFAGADEIFWDKQL